MEKKTGFEKAELELDHGRLDYNWIIEDGIRTGLAKAGL